MHRRARPLGARRASVTHRCPNARSRTHRNIRFPPLDVLPVLPTRYPAGDPVEMVFTKRAQDWRSAPIPRSFASGSNEPLAKRAIGRVFPARGGRAGDGQRAGCSVRWYGSDRHRAREAGDTGVHGACLPVVRASAREEMRRISLTIRSSSRLFAIHSRYRTSSSSVSFKPTVFPRALRVQ